MFRHVALFRWVPGTTAEQVAAVDRALGELPGRIAGLREYRTGPDAGLAPGAWDYAEVADFDDADGWRAYTVHPDHTRVIDTLIRPFVAERAAVQYDGGAAS